MNITELTKLLHAKINTAVTTEEVLALSKAIERLNIGSVRTVSTYTGLTSLLAIDGEVIFVEDEGALYYNFAGYWYKITTTASLRAWSWGAGAEGQLGNATIGSFSSPVSVLGGFTDWVQVSAGGFHSLGLRENGTAWAWGFNNSGRLGDGTVTNRSSPVAVVGGFTDWVELSASGRETNTQGHSLGLRSNGTAWSWGSGGYGQLGNGVTTISSVSPISVAGGFSDWTQLSAGNYQSLGIRTGGAAWGWGANSQGQLGDGTTVSKSSPVAVVGGLTWVQVSAGGFHSVGIRTNGTAWAWGSNSFGKLGNGITGPATSSPVAVVGGFNDWSQVSAGYRHTVALRTNGTAWSWGANSFYAGGFTYTGALGDGTSLQAKSSPVSVVGGFTNWVQVRVGLDHSTGLRADGTAWAWGLGNNGRLGDGTITVKSSPVSVVGGFTNWVDIDSGTAHTIAIRSSV